MSRVPQRGTPSLFDEPLRRGYREHPSNARYTRPALALTLLNNEDTVYETFSKQWHSEVRSYALLFVALTACTRQQRPVVLAPMRMETPDTSAAAPPARSVFDTQRDDPFATTNRIDWPGPNRYRSSSGSPGPDYWQQRADYTIAATLDTSTTELTGSVEIKYTNNSPYTLRYVWVQVDQNLFCNGEQGS